MKFALIGYGKIGKLLEKTLIAKGHQICAIIDPSHFGNKISEEELEQADVCMEFTNPASAVSNIFNLVALGKNIVVGTTGWEPSLEKVRELVESNGTSLFYASNFSLGMNLFIKIAQQAAEKLMSTGLYDVAGVEVHHKQKLDTPSGSANAIAKAISDSLDGEINVPFSSVRCGSHPGLHTILFDSSFDTLTLTHTARTRQGFAEGAIRAAEWLQGKKGIFTMDDLLFSGDTE